MNKFSDIELMADLDFENWEREQQQKEKKQ